MRHAELRPLLGAIRALITESRLDRLLHQILQAALQITDAERAFLLRIEGMPVVLASADARGREVRRAEEKVSRMVLSRVLSDRRPLVLRDGALSSGSLRRQRVRIVCAVPLSLRCEPVGVLYLDYRSREEKWVEDHLEILEALGAQAALALEREKTSPPKAAPIPRGNDRVMIGSSSPMRMVYERIRKFAPLCYPVLLEGESGTGKELVARAIHDAGPRRNAPFIAANVAAVPLGLFESEMFGHLRGAFTGADTDRKGLFEQAQGGTLLLDEINSLLPAGQEKLLRVLQEGEIRRVGESRSIPIDVRLVVTSNQSLHDLCRRGLFRSDLYHRLNVLRVHLPPLSERKEDIPALVDHLLDRIGREMGGRSRLEPEAMKRLCSYAWPGNIRELENALRRAAALSDGPVLSSDLLTLVESSADPPAAPLVSIEEYVRRTLLAYGPQMGRNELALRLGISRKTLWEMRRRWGIK